MEFYSKAMDVPTGEQVMATDSDTARLITSAADKIQKKSAGLSKDYKEIVRTPKQELAQPDITADTTATINRLLEISRESLIQGNTCLYHAMDLCAYLM